MYHLTSILFLSYLIHYSFGQSGCDSSNISATNVFKILTNESHYKKWVMPISENGEPLKVKVKLYIFHLNAKGTSRLDIKMLVLLELSWEDPRLSYKQITSSINSIYGRQSHIDAIWLPRVIFTNEKDSEKMGVGAEDDFVTILPTGSVLLMSRLSETMVEHLSIFIMAIGNLSELMPFLTANSRIMTSMVCLLHLGKFPFDQQYCRLKLDSLTYNSSRLQLVWDEDTPLQIGGLATSLMEFDILELKNKTSKDESPDYSDVQEYSSLIMEIKLERHSGYYIINYYFASALLVITSWFSFWLEPSIIPPRVLLGVSTMLTFITLDMTGNSLPRTSEFMANDIWFVTCTAFIFLSLAEFAFVNSIDRKQGVEKVHLKKLSSKYILRGGVDTAAGRLGLRRSSSCPSSPEIRRHFARNANAAKTFQELKQASISLGNLMQSVTDSRQTIPHTSHSVFTMTPQEIAIWIDAKCRVIFPLAFVIFNLIYWVPLIII